MTPCELQRPSPRYGPQGAGLQRCHGRQARLHQHDQCGLTERGSWD
jgi:hypothetical protein